METALGLIGMVVFIACVIALAAGVTFSVVRLTPTQSRRKSPKPDSSEGAA